MTDAELRQMFADIAVLKAQLSNLSREMETLSGRVRALEARGVAGGSSNNGRRQQFVTFGGPVVGGGGVVALVELARWATATFGG